MLTQEDILYMKNQDKNSLPKWDKRKLKNRIKVTDNLEKSYSLSTPYFSRDHTKAILFRSGQNEDTAFFFKKKDGKWKYFCKSGIRTVLIE